MTNYVTRFTNECIDDFINIDQNNKNVTLSGFCHNIRINKKMIFIVLRRSTETIQLIVFKNDSPDVYEVFNKLNIEATVEITGEIVKAQVKTCTVTNYEIKVNSVKVINSSIKDLAFGQDDANETFCSDLSEANVSTDDTIINEDSTNNAINPNDRCKVGRQTRLDNRWLDLRTPINHHIFKLRSGLEACIRNVLIQDGYVEIHTPKIIPAVSEGGSNVFDVNYFGQKVYLAQSPQLYKQMMINAGFEKVFEFGPVFRAENANTYRHLCEFSGFDMEFEIRPDQTHIDIINVIWDVLYRAFVDFETIYEKQIGYVLSKTGLDKLIFPKTPVLIDFKDGVKLLNDAGIEQDVMDDIGTVNEKQLGAIIKKSHNTDVYVLVGFPNNVRPFYTMKDDDNYSKSFDFMMRNNEIMSGAQRVHDPNELKKAILAKNIKLDGKSGLEDYVRSFETGSFPHGGCGIGVERLIMLYLGLSNIRTTSLFPRDPKRITP
jgi:aspartyl-tRNA synthetase